MTCSIVDNRLSIYRRYEATFIMRHADVMFFWILILYAKWYGGAWEYFIARRPSPDDFLHYKCWRVRGAASLGKYSVSDISMLSCSMPNHNRLCIIGQLEIYFPHFFEIMLMIYNSRNGIMLLLPAILQQLAPHYIVKRPTLLYSEAAIWRLFQGMNIFVSIV